MFKNAFISVSGKLYSPFDVVLRRVLSSMNVTLSLSQLSCVWAFWVLVKELGLDFYFVRSSSCSNNSWFQQLQWSTISKSKWFLAVGVSSLAFCFVSKLPMYSSNQIFGETVLLATEYNNAIYKDFDKRDGKTISLHCAMLVHVPYR